MVQNQAISMILPLGKLCHHTIAVIPMLSDHSMVLQSNFMPFLHYLSYIKISQTKRLKQLGTAFQISFNCSFRECAPFAECVEPYCCNVVRYFPKANQDLSNIVLSATKRPKLCTPSERAMETDLKYFLHS